MSWGIRHKRSNTTFNAVFPDSDAFPHEQPIQQGALALPTNLEEVVRATHTGVPRQLPAVDACQDEVRYFLYQILTLKEYRISTLHPQWVLETCMCWTGDGGKLRSLPLDAFQKLCPLSPGYANINWGVKGSKFKRQSIPPCDIRHGIGSLVRHMVTGLKTKEAGNQGPGWKDSTVTRVPTEVKPNDMCTPHKLVPELEHRSPTSYFAGTLACPVPRPFYSFSNHSMPLLHQTPSYGMLQHPMYIQHHASTIGSLFTLPATSTIYPSFHSAGGARPEPNDGSYNARLPPSSPLGSPPKSPPESPTSSYCQTESILSRVSGTTGRTSPPSSENDCFWDYDINRPGQNARAKHFLVDSGRTSSTTHLAPTQRTPAAVPSRYKASTQSVAATRTSGRSYDPRRYMANLRSGSYPRSEASLTPSDSATKIYSPTYGSAMPPNPSYSSLRQHSSFHPTKLSNVSSASTKQSHDSVMPRARSVFEPLVHSAQVPKTNSAISLMRSPTIAGRSSNNYNVDARAFNSAERVALKNRASVIHSHMPDAPRNHGSGLGKSEGGFSRRLHKFFQNVRGNKGFVGPSMRFQNPQTGQPRLTIYETIEETEKLGKMNTESKRRLDTWDGLGFTLYDRIEEIEILDGKSQRGADTTTAGGATSKAGGHMIQSEYYLQRSVPQNQCDQARCACIGSIEQIQMHKSIVLSIAAGSNSKILSRSAISVRSCEANMIHGLGCLRDAFLVRARILAHPALCLHNLRKPHITWQHCMCSIA